MKPINEYIKDPDLSTGGSLVTFTGPPGCGKTNTLIQVAIDRFFDEHKVLWRATKQSQWAAFLANDVPVKLWIDDNIEDVEAWVSKKDGVEHIDIEDKVSEVGYFDEEEEIVRGASSDMINVVIVPGMLGDTYEKYYFRKTWINILSELVQRKDVANPFSFFTDEGGDIWPCQQQLRKPFYKLVAEDTPPLLAQLRKQLVFMYIAAHSTHDLHYFVWKIKGNTIGYMSNSNVQKDLHQQVDQTKVNALNRGEVIVPPMDRDGWHLAHEPEDLEWVGEGNRFRMDWVQDIPNLLEDDDKVDISSIEQIPQQYQKTLRKKEKKKFAHYLKKEVGMTYTELTDVDSLPDNRSTLNNWVKSQE